MTNTVTHAQAECKSGSGIEKKANKELFFSLAPCSAINLAPKYGARARGMCAKQLFGLLWVASIYRTKHTDLQELQSTD